MSNSEYEGSLWNELVKIQKKLDWIVFHSIDSGCISRAKGAELLDIPLIDLDEYRNKVDNT